MNVDCTQFTHIIIQLACQEIVEPFKNAFKDNVVLIIAFVTEDILETEQIFEQCVMQIASDFDKRCNEVLTENMQDRYPHRDYY